MTPEHKLSVDALGFSVLSLVDVCQCIDGCAVTTDSPRVARIVRRLALSHERLRAENEGLQILLREEEARNAELRRMYLLPNDRDRPNPADRGGA